MGENKENESQAPNKPPANPVIIFSGMQSRTVEELTVVLTRLGAETTDSPSVATHLVMGRLMRTMKLVQCLPRVNHVLSEDWIRKSGEEGRWLPETGFMLAGPETEKYYRFSLAATLARTNRDKLFSGKVFYITPSVVPSMKVLTDIIESAGGKVDLRRRKTPEQIAEMNTGGNTNYIVITCEEDIYLVKDILSAKFGVFSAEFVLSSVLRCEMELNDLSSYLIT